MDKYIKESNVSGNMTAHQQPLATAFSLSLYLAPLPDVDTEFAMSQFPEEWEGRS